MCEHCERQMRWARISWLYEVGATLNEDKKNMGSAFRFGIWYEEFGKCVQAAWGTRDMIEEGRIVAFANLAALLPRGVFAIASAMNDGSGTSTDLKIAHWTMIGHAAKTPEQVRFILDQLTETKRSAIAAGLLIGDWVESLRPVKLSSGAY